MAAANLTRLSRLLMSSLDPSRSLFGPSTRIATDNKSAGHLQGVVNDVVYLEPTPTIT